LVVAEVEEVILPVVKHPGSLLLFLDEFVIQQVILLPRKDLLQLDRLLRVHIQKRLILVHFVQSLLIPAHLLRE